jgi:D-sedoheptulose 7-phosphate isomerase|tara:strand:+ start:20 stop:637 length:618 start_codon:yes stop_codon:yes gene_type:complete
MNFPKKKYIKIEDYFLDYLNVSNEVIKKIDMKILIKIANLLENKIKSNKNIFVCGNGGSAAIANHYVADYLKLLRTNTKLKPKFISLVSNLELITAISNDINYDKIFSYQIESLANNNDLLIMISSSGNSKNLINALKIAKNKKMKIISFVGFNGGLIHKKSDLSLLSEVNNYGISEDIAHILMHIIIQFLRQKNLVKDLKKVKF